MHAHELIIVVLQVCPVAPDPTFDLPQFDIGDVFPFSLLIWLWQVFGDLSGGGSAPCISAGQFGQLCLPDSDMAVMVRNGLGVVMSCGMALWFYRYITGKGEDA